MPRRVARPRLERNAGVVDEFFLLSLCLDVRLGWVVNGPGGETTLDEEDIDASFSILEFIIIIQNVAGKF